MSENKDYSKLYACISAVMKDIGGITKDGKVTGKTSYKYITADNVLFHASESMAKHGLVVIPSIVSQDTKEVIYNSYGQEKSRYESIVKFEITIACQDSNISLLEDWVGYGVNHQSPDKALYAAITSGHKYFYLKLFAVAVDNTDSEHEKPPQQPKQKQQTTQPKPQNNPPFAPASPKAKPRKQVVKQPTQPQKQEKVQSPKEWLASIDKPKYSDIQAALVLTGKFENEDFAWDMIESFNYHLFQELKA